MDLPPFDRLLREHARDVHRYLVASIGPDQADDCFQEAMLSALRAYPALRDDANLRGWLFTIAARKVTDSHRVRQRQGRLVAAAAVAGGAQPDAAAPADRTVGDDDLWFAVRDLPPKQCSAIVLRYVHDLPYREIGEILDCSEPAARQNVRAGLQALRQGHDA